jgi:GrpB-like predicted nucleotidyltransferase (UPF0157 family)
VPHLTVAQRPGGSLAVLREAERAVQRRLPLATRVEYLLLIAGTRAVDSWRIVHKFPLPNRDDGHSQTVPGHRDVRVVSDEELRRVTVGDRAPHNGPVVLAEYDPNWPRCYDREAARIRAALGAKALVVEHVGSTSVPGLAAKPVIDMLLVVPDSADESGYLEALEAAGYVLRIREPDWFEHRLFKGPDTDINMHVFTRGASEIDKMLLFRDWLRTSEADRSHYERTKLDLATRVWRHVQHYADAKTAVVQEIMQRAELGLSR